MALLTIVSSAGSENAITLESPLSATAVQASAIHTARKIANARLAIIPNHLSIL